MTTKSKEYDYKNEFLKSTYDRKLQIRYDRLLLVLKENSSRISCPSNYINYIFGSFVSLLSVAVTLLTSEFPKKWDWGKPAVLIVCVIASIYYVGYLLYMICRSKSPEDIIYRLEMDNELNENNVRKKRRNKKGGD